MTGEEYLNKDGNFRHESYHCISWLTERFVGKLDAEVMSETDDLRDLYVVIAHIKSEVAEELDTYMKWRQNRENNG